MCQCAAIGLEYCPVGELLVSLLTGGLTIQAGWDSGLNEAWTSLGRVPHPRRAPSDRAQMVLIGSVRRQHISGSARQHEDARIYVSPEQDGRDDHRDSGRHKSRDPSGTCTRLNLAIAQIPANIS